MIVMHFLIPLAAVALNFVVQVVQMLRQDHAAPSKWAAAIRDLALKGANYVAVIGVLELAGRFIPQLSQWAYYGMYALAFAEMASALATAKAPVPAMPDPNIGQAAATAENKPTGGGVA